MRDQVLYPCGIIPGKVTEERAEILSTYQAPRFRVLARIGVGILFFFVLSRTHRVNSDAHVKYSRACIMLFLRLLPQSTHLLVPYLLPLPMQATYTCRRPTG